MTLVVRPIRYSSRVPEMRAWAERLGMSVLLDTPDWVVLGAARGRLALHAVPAGDPLDGTTTLAVESDDLDALERRWVELGLTIHRVQEHGIPLLFASTPFGGEIAAGVLSPSGGGGGDVGLAVMPMLVTPDTPAAADWFAGWGWRRRIVSDGGGWADLELPERAGGLLGIHRLANLESEPPTLPPGAPMPEVPVSLTFEHPDVDALLAHLEAVGVEDAHVHDEAYNRTLILPSPDGDEIWVNGVQTDLYGYRKV